MIMNNTISFDTRSAIAAVERDLGHARGGKNPLHSIGFKNFKIVDSEILINELCTGELVVGDVTVQIFFHDAVELIAFCEKHAIDFKDKREQKQKLIEAAL